MLKNWGIFINGNFTCDRKRKPSNNTHMKTCPFCGKIVDNRNYSRWHGKNCNQTKYILKNIKTNEILRLTHSEVTMKTNMNRSDFHSLKSGKCKTSKGWMLIL